MILVLFDDGELRSYGNVRAVEDDIERQFLSMYRFYDDDGAALKPRFLRERAAILGVKLTNDPGPFELVRDQESPDLQAVLSQVTNLHRGVPFESIDALSQYLRDR